MKLLVVLPVFLAVFPAFCFSFCFHEGGGIGEYHKACSDSIGRSVWILHFHFMFPCLEMEACYARCNCWSDFPDMGGQITHEVDAQCFLDSCWCSYNQVSGNTFLKIFNFPFPTQDLCPYGTLKTNPYCCTKNGITCDDVHCDTEGNCDHD